MKPAERKSIDRKNVAMMPLEPPLKFEQPGRLDQLAGSLVAQPQTDGVGCRVAELFFDRQRPAIQRFQGLRPSFAGMNVRAVSQMQAVVESHFWPGTIKLWLWLRNFNGL